ncbi:SRPBCC family protein [Lysinibacillus pakistanensis]|nr:SRPBCC family protein [Lysinibacillus pakistanensis]WHY44692.1 SRPBCC family protein [Lysinibacillus pakistanensis]
MMWKYENSIITEATPEAIWKLYNSVDKWKKWDGSILEVKINGPFEEGVTGDLTLLGREPLLFTLTEVKENKLFTNTTILEQLSIKMDFRHEIEILGIQTKVTHSVILSGPNAEMIGNQIGPMITQGIPNSMSNLNQLARGDIS